MVGGKGGGSIGPIDAALRQDIPIDLRFSPVYNQTALGALLDADPVQLGLIVAGLALVIGLVLKVLKG